jgi:hypothetical protein
VNGEVFESTIAEAVLLSSTIYESLQSDRGVRTFQIADDAIEANSFRDFLNLCRKRECSPLHHDTSLTFLSLCGLLGNERLSLVILASLGEVSASNSNSSLGLDSHSGSNVCGRSNAFMNLDIDHCALQFHCYSTELLRHIDKHTLHRILGSPSLRIDSEDALCNSLIDLGSSYFEFWRYIEIRFLTTDGLSRFLDNLPFDELNIAIWSKIVDRLKGISDTNLQCERFRIVQVPFASMILTEIPDILEEFRNKKWKLLYRGTVDGFSSSTFDHTCDGAVNTIKIILTTKGFIFGGFTPIGWDSSSSYKNDNSQTNFLFTMKNPRNSIPHRFPMSSSAKCDLL